MDVKQIKPGTQKRGTTLICSGASLFAGANPVVWTDLDCGTGEAVVLLKVQNAPGLAVTQTLQFRRKGDALTSSKGSLVNANFGGAVGEIGFVCVPTNSSGVIQWKGSTLGSTEIWLLGYWKALFPDTVVWTGGSLPTTFEELSLGYPNSICILKFASDVAPDFGGVLVSLRQTGEAETPGAGVEYCAMASTFDAYAAMLTDSAGNVEWIASAAFAANTHSVTLVAVISPSTVVPVELWNALIDTTWVELDSTFPKGFTFMRGYNATGQANVSFRESGDTLLAEFNAGCASLVTGVAALVAYSLVPLSTSGKVEMAKQIGGDFTWELRSLAYCIC